MRHTRNQVHKQRYVSGLGHGRAEHRDSDPSILRTLGCGQYPDIRDQGQGTGFIQRVWYKRGGKGARQGTVHDMKQHQLRQLYNLALSLPFAYFMHLATPIIRAGVMAGMIAKAMVRD